MTTLRRTFKNETVKLALLADEENNVEGIHATDVAFVGPAVIAFQGTAQFQDITFLTDDIHALLWDVAPHRAFAAGAIGLTNGTFIRCTFKGIGLAGDSDTLARLVQTFTVPSKG